MSSSLSSLKRLACSKHFLFFLFFLICSKAGFSQPDTIKYTGLPGFCPGGNKVLTADPAPAGANYQWRLNNGPVSTLSSFTVTAAGTVTLTVNGTPYQSLVISAYSNPIANYTFTPNNQCGSVPVQFINTSSGNGLTYSWNFNDPNSGSNNASVLPNPSHRFVGNSGNGTQNFNVVLTATSSEGCTGIKQQPPLVTIKQNPSTKLDGPNPKTYNGMSYFTECTGTASSASLDFLNASTTSATNTSYTIVWGDGQQTTVSSFNGIIPHTYNRGNYPLLFIVTGGNGCVDTGYYSVFVGSNPAVGLRNPGNTIICTGSSITFPIIDSGTNSEQTTYVFSVNDGTPVVNLSSPLPNSISHTFNTTSCGTTGLSYPNSFVASLVASNPCLTSTSPVAPIYVSQKPVAGISISPKDTVCVNTLTTITNSSTSNTYVTVPDCNSGKLVWTITPASGWTLINGNFGTDNGSPNPGSWSSLATQSLNIRFDVVGVYTIKMKIGNPNCGKDSTTRTICVNPAPVGAFTVDKTTGCAPLTVATTNTSNTPNCGNNTYGWSVSYTPFTGCLPNTIDYIYTGGTNAASFGPQFQFNSPGTYTISLVTKNSGGACTAPTVTKQIIVKAKPTVGINTLSALCAGNTIAPGATYSNCSSTTAPIIHWTFTGGFPDTSTALTPGPIRYDSVGNYPVTLILQNECGISNTATDTVRVRGKPDADAGPDKVICSNTSDTIGTNTGNYTYSWSPSTGLSSTGVARPTVRLTYTGPNADTTFKYYVTVSAGTNCSNRDSVLVTVKKNPVVTVSPVSAVSCNGGAAILIASGAATYSWNPAVIMNSTGDTVRAIPPVTNPATTTFIVTGTLNGCKDSAQAIVTSRRVKADSSYMCNTSTAVQMTATPAGGTWSGHPAITSAGIFNPSVAGIGSHNIIYTYLGCSDSAKAIVNAGDSARAGNDSAICQHPGTIQLNGQPAGGTWSGSPLVTAGGVFNTNTPGTYTLIYRTGSGNCTARDTVVITINGGITNNAISADRGYCYGEQPIMLNGQVVNGGNGMPQYQWQDSLPGGNWSNIVNATGQNYTPPVVIQTIYYRRLASTTLCNGPQTSNSQPVKITLNPDARALFTASKTVGCVPFTIDTAIHLSQFPAADSAYRWYIYNAGGVLVQTGSGIFCPSYPMSIPGDSATVKLVAISRYGCKNDSMQIGFKTIARPVPAFTQSDSVGCGPVKVLFTNGTLNATQYSYLWLFGNGNMSTQQQPDTITFQPNPLSGDTIYTVRFITISQCSRDTLLRYVRVKSKPKALFTPDRSTGCSSYNFTFTNTSRGNGNSYVWDFGDGSAPVPTNAATVQHIYHTGNITTFYVKLKATNECGTDSLIYNLVVQPINIRPDVAINGLERYGCAPHTVHFINNSQGGSRFDWDFGDGGTTTTFLNVDTVPHRFLLPGTYTVKMRATNNCSDTSDIELVTVYIKPTVSFSANPATLCFGDTAHFNNTTVDTALSWRWTYGDGSPTDIIRNPTHVYASGNIYQVRLIGTKIYTGTSCADTAYKTIIVKDTLPGNFSANPLTAACTPDTVTFINLNRPAVQTTWNFGDNTPSVTGDSVVHIYQQPGTYRVKMIGKNSLGCTDTATRTIVITSPNGTLLYSSGYVCPNDSLRIEIVSNNATQFNYVFGDGTSLSTSGSIVYHHYLQPGSYVPYAYVISGNCQKMLVKGDTVKVDRLRTGFKYVQQQQCGSTTLGFTDTSFAWFGIQSRLWSFGDGTTSLQQNPVHTYTQSGTYTVRLRIVGRSGCIDTATVPITIAVHNIPVSTISSDTSVCIGQPLPFTALAPSNPDPVTNYDWDFGNGTTGNGQNVTAVYNTAGVYTVRLISRTAFPCTDTAYRTIRVAAAPLVSVGPGVRICRGDSVRLSAIGAGVTAWQWSPQQGLSCTNCPNPMAKPLFTTTYTVTGSNGALCRGNASITVEVVQPFNLSVSPTVTFCYPDTVQLEASGAYTYNWSPATSLSNPALSNPMAYPAATTVYQVVGKDRYNCFTDTDYVRVNVGRYPTVDLGTGGTVTAGTQLVLTPVITNGPIIRYTWTPATDLSCSNCPRPTATINRNVTYKLVATNNFGCSGSDTIIYKVNCDAESQRYVPNAFSPDGDGTNDVFMMQGKGIASIKSFRVFNRWGQVVFERSNINANDPQQGWDGKINGVPAQVDVYAVTIEWLCTGGATFTYKGNVTLLR